MGVTILYEHWKKGLGRKMGLPKGLLAKAGWRNHLSFGIQKAVLDFLSSGYSLSFSLGKVSRRGGISVRELPAPPTGVPL